MSIVVEGIVAQFCIPRSSSRSSVVKSPAIKQIFIIFYHLLQVCILFLFIDGGEKMTIIDQTETNLVALRRTIYLTIQSR